MKNTIIAYLLISIFIPLQQQFEIKECSVTMHKDPLNLPDTASNLTKKWIQKNHNPYDYSKSCQEYDFPGKVIRRVNPITRVKSLYTRIF